MNQITSRLTVAAATVLATIVSYFVPESASAQLRVRYSGSPNAGVTFLNFNLDTSVQNSADPSSGMGLFKEAIQDATFTCVPGGGFDETQAKQLCDNEMEASVGPSIAGLAFKPGDLIATPITLSDLSDNFQPQDSDFLNGVKYEATLNDIGSSDFIEFDILVKPNGSLNLINSLSDLSSVLTSTPQNVYVGVRNLNSAEGSFVGAGQSFTTVPTTVPEPDVTGSLLSAGAIGTVLLLKRNQRLRKSSSKATSIRPVASFFQGSQNSGVEMK